MKKLINFIKEEEGATAVEYGLMIALIAAVIIAAVELIGDHLKTTFEYVQGKLEAAVPE